MSHVYCTAPSCKKLSTCSSRWLHSTSAGYSSSSQVRVLYLGTLSTARMVSTWGKSAPSPSSTLNMECISLDYLQKLIAEGMFMSSAVEGTLELSGMTVKLLIFQADDQHEQITKNLHRTHGTLCQFPPLCPSKDLGLCVQYRG